MNHAEYFFSRIFRQNAACRPSALQVHLSSARIPANVPSFAPGPASPEAGRPTPVLPPHPLPIASRTAVPLPPESRGSPIQSSFPPYAPPATAEPPPPPRPGPAVPLAPRAVLPETHSPAPAHAAGYFETSPRNSARRRSASSGSALRPASSLRVGRR